VAELGKRQAAYGNFPLVIPAKAGIQRLATLHRRWIPAFAGMTIFFVPSGLPDGLTIHRQST